MNKSYSLLFAFLITGLIAGNVYLFSHSSITGKTISEESVFVSRVIDGDTLKLEDGRTIRFLNINSPEKGTPFYASSLALAKSLENKTIEVQIVGTDKYRRNLARIYYNNSYINLEIVKEGHASKFLVQESELKKFDEAEKYAIENSLGIWKKSAYFDCFKSKTDKNKEIVELENSCESINIKDWVLKDESRKSYKFGNITIGEVKLHSREGTDNSTDIFWHSKTDVWNSDRDTLYLFEPRGEIVRYETYGY